MAINSGLTKRRRLRKKAEQATKKAKLGTGKRFAAVKESVKAGLKKSQLRPGQTKEEAAAAIAAAAGRRKYGKRRMQKMAAKGRKGA